MLGGTKKDRRQPTRAAAPSAVLASTEYVARRIRRHLVDLERTNYTEPSGGGGHYSGKMIEDGTGDGGGDDGDERGGGEGENDSTTGGGAGGGRRKKGGSKAVRALLVYRKTLAGLIEESNLPKPTSSDPSTSTTSTTPNYLTISSPPSRFPPLQMCSVCGYKGKYQCLRCGSRYCDLGCKTTHDESRCERR